jgi:hypothetical protein
VRIQAILWLCAIVSHCTSRSSAEFIRSALVTTASTFSVAAILAACASPHLQFYGAGGELSDGEQGVD